jgi:hypothetical protein
MLSLVGNKYHAQVTSLPGNRSPIWWQQIIDTNKMATRPLVQAPGRKGGEPFNSTLTNKTKYHISTGEDSICTHKLMGKYTTNLKTHLKDPNKLYMLR